jgi:fibronectin-binding autotransporter adhesin
MAHKTVEPGQTLTLAQAFTFDGSGSISGATGAGPGGLVRVTNVSTFTSSAMIGIGGGVGSTAGHAAGGGGELQVTGVLTSYGLIGVAGGGGSHVYPGGTGGAGGTLSVTGTLVNDGTIALAGGSEFESVLYAAGRGATLVSTGVLVNNGLIVATGNALGRSDTSATIDNVGTLTNTGTIALASQSSSGELLNTGVLVNSGAITVAAGYDYAAEFYNTGITTNTGLITLQGGEGAFGPYGGSGGGLLYDIGSFTNDGTITAQGGGRPGYFGGGGGSEIRVKAGVLTNDGVITLASGATDQYGSSFGGELITLPTGSLVNDGTINAQSGALISVYEGLTNYGQIDLYGLSPQQAASSLKIGSEAILALGTGSTLTAIGNFGSAAAVTNDGLMKGSGLVDGGALYNQGTIEAVNGPLVITSDIIGSGTLGQSDFLGMEAGTLTLEGTIGSGQQAFIGSGAIVTGIDNASLLVSSTRGQSDSKLEFTGGSSGTLNAVDTKLTVQLDQASTLTLSLKGFLTADGSSGNDNIVALAAGQTLTGGLGIDLMTGAAATGDTFKDTSLGLTGDTIGDFAGTDVIDVTDLVPGTGLSLAYTQEAGQGILTLSEGVQSVTINLLGSFTSGQFTTSSDAHGGVLIGLH